MVYLVYLDEVESVELPQSWQLENQHLALVMVEEHLDQYLLVLVSEGLDLIDLVDLVLVDELKQDYWHPVLVEWKRDLVDCWMKEVSH